MVQRFKGQSLALAKVVIVFVALLALVWLPILKRSYPAYGVTAAFMVLASFDWQQVTGIMQLDAKSRIRALQVMIDKSGLFPTTYWLFPVSIGVGLAVAAGLAIGGWYFETTNTHRLYAFPTEVLKYWGWTCVQMGILLGFFYRQLSIVFNGENTAVCVITGLQFGVIHLANPLLTLVCTIGGLMIAFAYRRWRGIVCIALAQAIVACAIMTFVPERITRGMRVGKMKPVQTQVGR